MAAKEGAQQGPPVDLGVVQQEEDGPAEVTQQVAEGEDDVSGTEVLVELAAEVQPAVPPARAEREGGKDGDPVMTLPVAEYGGAASGRPGTPYQRRQLEAGFIQEDEVGAQPPGVFFTRGQTTRFHRSMAASSRSSARRSGFWGLQPIWCRSRPT